MRAGVIDVGTNSVRMLVVEGPGPTAGIAPALEEVERDLIITRLGEGVDRAGAIASEPLRRTVAAVAAYAERCRLAGARAIRLIATSAVRDAANREEFLDAVRRGAEVEPEVLTGEQEARLGFLGATADVDTQAPFLVADVGGGSTELVRGTTRAERWTSMDIGSVRLTERHIGTDPPAETDVAALRADARAHLDAAAAAVGGEAPGTLIGLAGTITTVTAIGLGLPGYDRAAIHHARLARAQVTAIRARLASMTTAQRRALPVMPPGREDVIVGGVVIFEEIMARFGCDTCLVSESDILDGAALEVLSGLSSPHASPPA